MADTVVICQRDPDSSNDFTVFPEASRVSIVDIDYGYTDLRSRPEFESWAESLEEEAVDLERDGHKEAAKFVRSTISEARDNYDHPGPEDLLRRAVESGQLRDTEIGTMIEEYLETK